MNLITLIGIMAINGVYDTGKATHGKIIMANILIVDDQSHLREFFAQELIEEGHKVLDVVDAGSVRKCFRDFKPDLVLLNLCLNRFEGLDVLRYVKRKDPHIPVLIVTAYDNYMDDPRLSEADGYVIKNFNHLCKLKKKIAYILDRKTVSHSD